MFAARFLLKNADFVLALQKHFADLALR